MEILGFRLTIQGAVGQSTTDLQNYSSYSGDKWDYYWYIEDNGDFTDFAIVRKILFFRKKASKATNYYELLDSDNKLSGYVAQFDVAGDTCYFIAWNEYSSKNNTSIIINGDECDLIQGSAFEYDKDFSNIEIKGDEYKLETIEIPEY